jgi:hypothetical protein
VSAHIYIEGAESKQDQILCRQAFSKLFEKAGFAGRLPRTTACGSRNAAFGDFCTRHSTAGAGDFIALLIDSEDPLRDLNAAWSHLHRRDGWQRPAGASDEQVLFMTTCMESWIAADRPTLRRVYGAQLQESALPPLHDLEGRPRHEVLDALVHATRECTNKYRKGRRSFLILGELEPGALQALPSFARAFQILDRRL